MSPSHAPNNQTPYDDNIDVIQVIRSLQTQLQQQQNRIQELEAANVERDGEVVYRNTRATTLKLYDELLD
ncbi:hypothetical protein BGZ58_004758, partial [Dissophora ornata]